MRVTSNRVRGLCLAALVWGWATSANATSDEERATARSLANQGITAFKAKRFGEAADLFQRAESLVHSPVHLLYLGRSYSQIGKLVRAQEAYLQATREELSPSSPAAFSRAVDDAATELEAMKPRLAQLTISVVGLKEGETAEVAVDGEGIPGVMVGVPVPMDPGQHRVDAKAPRYLAAWRKVSLSEGQTERVNLELVADPNAPETVAEPAETAGNAGTDTPTQQTPAKHKESGGNPIFLYSSLGALAIGLGGVGWGTYDLLVAFDARSEGNNKFNDCPFSMDDPNKRVCSDEVKRQIDDLDRKDENYRTQAVVPYIIGGVGLALGTTLLVLYANSASDNSAATGPGLKVQPWVGWKSAGVVGTF